MDDSTNELSETVQAVFFDAEKVEKCLVTAEKHFLERDIQEVKIQMQRENGELSFCETAQYKRNKSLTGDDEWLRIKNL